MGWWGSLVEVTNGFSAMLVFLPTRCAASPNIYTVYIWDVVFVQCRGGEDVGRLLSYSSLCNRSLYRSCQAYTHTHAHKHSLSLSFFVTCYKHSHTPSICLSPLARPAGNEISTSTSVGGLEGVCMRLWASVGTERWRGCVCM